MILQPKKTILSSRPGLSQRWRLRTLSGAALLATLMLAACGIGVPFTYHDTSANIPANQSAQGKAVSANDLSEDGKQDSGDWWDVFHDAQLSSYIKQALSQNLTLRDAAYQVDLARLAVGATAASQLPTLSGNLNSSARKNLSDQTGSYRSYSSNFSLSYEVDLWGKLASRNKADEAGLEASEFNRQASQLIQIREVANQYWRIALQHDRIRLAVSDRVLLLRIYELVKAQQSVGRATSYHVAEAQRVLLLNKAEILREKLDLQVARRALAILIGQPPETRLPELSSLDNTVISEVSAGLPADVITRRPDIRAREANIRANIARYNEARQNYWPTFNVEASIGTSTNSTFNRARLSDLFSNPIGTLVGAIAFPILNWPTLRYTTEQRRIELEQQKTAFTLTVYQALSEVYQLLDNQNYFADYDNILLVAVRDSDNIVKRDEYSYRAGRTTLRSWLESQRSARNDKINLLSNRFERLNNQMQLYRAIGGGPTSDAPAPI